MGSDRLQASRCNISGKKHINNSINICYVFAVKHIHSVPSAVKKNCYVDFSNRREQVNAELFIRCNVDTTSIYGWLSLHFRCPWYRSEVLTADSPLSSHPPWNPKPFFKDYLQAELPRLISERSIRRYLGQRREAEYGVARSASSDIAGKNKTQATHKLTMASLILFEQIKLVFSTI